MKKIKRLFLKLEHLPALAAFLIAALQAQKSEEKEYLGENMPFTLIDSLNKA